MRYKADNLKIRNEETTANQIEFTQIRLKWIESPTEPCNWHLWAGAKHIITGASSVNKGAYSTWKNHGTAVLRTHLQYSRMNNLPAERSDVVFYPIILQYASEPAVDQPVVLQSTKRVHFRLTCLASSLFMHSVPHQLKCYWASD